MQEHECGASSKRYTAQLHQSKQSVIYTLQHSAIIYLLGGTALVSCPDPHVLPRERGSGK